MVRLSIWKTNHFHYMKVDIWNLLVKSFQMIYHMTPKVSSIKSYKSQTLFQEDIQSAIFPKLLTVQDK